MVARDGVVVPLVLQVRMGSIDPEPVASLRVSMVGRHEVIPIIVALAFVFKVACFLVV